jgi:hypothetical protein
MYQVRGIGTSQTEAGQPGGLRRCWRERRES